ncbi:MAG: ATP-binding protein [Cyanobacteriota bacterium]|nr:ATP-binding protein [Cyanobacteriota bacterium]
MLIEFSVGNYRSFKEVVTLSMVATSLTAKDKRIDESNTFRVDENLRLLKSVAIYGANASGKSNLVDAIGFMKWFIINSSKATQINETIPIKRFRLSSETDAEPSYFEIVFILEGKIYRYGFEVNEKRVISEWLFHVPKKKEHFLFERRLDTFKMTNIYSEGKYLKDKTRENALFLSVVAQFNGKISQKILSWIGELILLSGLHGDIYREITADYFKNPQYQQEIIQLIKKLDLGIESISVKQSFVELTKDYLPGNIPEDLKKVILDSMQDATLQTPANIKTLHQKYDAEGNQTSKELFDLDDDESEGTKKLFAFAGPLLEALKEGSILIIDELAARLHPLMTREIVKLFNSNETNPRNAQLVFMTHDTNLLTNALFRRDQIWFVEKNRKGMSNLYSLAEYTVRNDASFEKDYIKGKYGAIPYIGDLRGLIDSWNE